MKFTYSWLKEHLETEKSPAEIAEKLTALGLEIEEFTDMGAKYEPFLVAEILEAEKHPNADKLQVCKVNNGTETLQIVCGAPNARKGIKVCLAPVGAYIPAADFKIKPTKIRDVESNGMLCSAAELGLGEDTAGIMELGADAKVGSKYADYAGLNDSFFEIAITPNRQDCLGVRGIARDLAAANYGKLNALDHPSGLSNHSLKCPIDVGGAIYYVGRYFQNVQNQPSPAWLQNRLKSIGLEPISALVDITNYITFDLGRPLHVYDADKLQGNLTIREAKKGEKINALNNKEYELQGFEPVIADDNGVVALAGVIGNIESSVDENTKNIFLEVAYFDADEVAKSGRAHQIDSDARYRFERGIDPDFLITGADIATNMILEICGGETSEMIHCGEEPNWHNEIEFDFAKVKSLGGIDIPREACEEILVDLGFAVKGNKISVPSWRRDVEGTADLVEEILRINGYDKVEPQILPFSGIKSQKSVIRKIRDILASRGLTEAVTYSFLCETAAQGFGGGSAALKVSNPISSELSDMRPSILPNLLEAARNNANRGVKNLSLFEIGPIFNENGEQQTVSSIRVGKNADKNIYGDSRKIDVFDAKADILAVLESLGAPEAQIRTENLPKYYHPGRSAGLYLGKNCLGYFGEIHPATLKTCDISDVVVGFELFMDNIPQGKSAKAKYKQLVTSDFQPTSRDFAFIVPNDVKAGEIVTRVQKLDDLITSAQIFDVFEGKNIEEGKKSLAFSVHLQPTKATLTDAEIEKVSSSVINLVEKEYSGVLRK
ncbi:MAG: phenylalanine--tRNA ligase subunit beta [Alphaproteobacteria bacterium CG11_big_fil_rev_8_21_14_0_20_44_7]|nr:MAG: phenylalanine--tRNA ligase subunit beta [Alphaproteobacteria bacterium CG11_big_fil_rev_8_21_14_0_20_44_7]